MKLRLVLSLSLLLPLMACSKSPAPAATPAPVAEVPAPTPAPAATPAPVTEQAVATQVPASAPQPAATPGIVEGTDFSVIPGGQPFAPVKGKIEVVEFFNYICPGCAAFNPGLQKWKAKLAGDVNVVYVPADFRPDFVPYARAYYAAESFGVAEQSHDAVYMAIHDTHQLPGEGQPLDDARIAGFYVQYGVGAELFVGAMHSFAVDNKIRQGRDFLTRSKVVSTPSLVIDGKYLVKGQNFDDKLRIADALIARERAAH